jgi:CSLREA domain-containing protein
MNVFSIRAMALLSIGSCATAAIPANDQWANRIVISAAQLAGGFSNVQSDINEATTESTDPQVSCEISNPDTTGNTVWYELNIGAQDTYVKVSGAGLDSTLAIFTGAPGSFVPVVGACNDDGGAALSALIDGIRLQANTRYSVMVARPAQNPNAAVLTFGAGIAAVKRVTKTTDSNDGDCSAADCSIREAIITSTGGAIEIPAGNYSISIAGSGEDTGNTGDLDISKGVFLYGASSASTLITATTADRIFDIDPSNSLLGPTVSLNFMTIKDGNSGFGAGGCVRSADPSVDPANEYLVLNNVVLDNCRSSLGGGALSSPSAPLHVFETTIKNSTAGSGGGGVVFGRAAGISLARGLIEKSTISGNTSDSSFSDGGGGIQGRGSLVILSSTVSGNRAKFNGGGILITSNNGRLTMLDSTIHNNNSDYDAINGGNGGGLRFDVAATSPSTYVITNSVFADNRNQTNAQDCHSTSASNVITSAGSWWQMPDSSCTLSAAINTVNAPAALTSLANNGGPTQTVLPQVGSGLINPSNAVSCLSTDQRGVSRPQAAGCDIGAVEVSASLPDSIFANGFE